MGAIETPVLLRRQKALLRENKKLKAERDTALERLGEVQKAVQTLNDDLVKADPHHFSIGLMRGRTTHLLKMMRGEA